MIASVSLFPLGKGESLGRYIADALKEVEKSGLDYRLTAMGTILEGDWDEVLAVIKKMRARLLKSANRVYITISIDDRKNHRGLITAKVKRVETLLGKSLKK